MQESEISYISYMSAQLLLLGFGLTYSTLCRLLETESRVTLST